MDSLANYGSDVTECYKITELIKFEINLIAPVVEQCNYNMIVRDRVESEYRDLFKRYRMGTTIWSPLESGILARRYLNGVPGDSRYKLKHDNVI